MYRINKNKLIEVVDKLITDFNIGSYRGYDDYREDYFDDAENKDEILESVKEVIESYGYLKNEEIDKFCERINSIELIVDESVDLNDYTCFYKNATLGDRLYLDKEEVKEYLIYDVRKKMA